MHKWITAILAALLVITNGFWLLYSTFDLAVTEKYSQQEEYEKAHQVEALTKLNNHFVKGMTKDELNRLLFNLFPDFEPYEKEGHLNTIWLSF